MESILYYELLDRIYFVMTMINEMIIDHPATVKNDDIVEYIDKAMDDLMFAYNIAGRLKHKAELEGE